MSAGMDLEGLVAPSGTLLEPAFATALVVQHSLGLLAPRFRTVVEDALRECERLSLQAVVYETYRSDALQKLYYARGRTVRPPDRTVTNAPDNLASWHGYGLAVDVIHRRKRWDMPDAWFHAVAKVFKSSGCDWGGDWRRPDLPHFQLAGLRDSPSIRARELIAAGGLEAVWREVGAL
jgi:peptidoglycan LD-endopeptidase CwlK